MAISPDYPGLIAEVVVNGEPLKEYEDHDADTSDERQAHVVTRYVQVDSDAHFGIRYTIPKDLNGTCGVRSDLKVDGKNAVFFSHRPESIAKHNVTKCLDKVYSTIDGADYTQKLRFSQLHIDEEGPDLDDNMGQQLKRVGTLTLNLSFIDSVSRREIPYGKIPSRGSGPGGKLPTLGKVAEKSLKGDARSHQASLDTPEFQGAYVPRREKVSFHLGETFAVFQFKYRSASALKSLHIIPRTPSSSPPLQIQPGVGDMSKEELEATVLAHRREFIDETKYVKRESTAGIKREANSMSTEGEVEFMSSKRLKHLPTSKDEVIVLD